jgi:hypothetical protein
MDRETRKLVRRATWLVVAGGSAMLASRLMTTALRAGWRAARGEDPPQDPEHPDTDLVQALLWTATTGAALAITSVLAARGAARGWERVTGTRPPIH